MIQILWIEAALAIMLMATGIQNCYSQNEQLSRDWNTACQDISSYYASYGNIHPGLKVLDALNAQTFYIESKNPDIGVSYSF